jgi:hypothetical protein
MSYFSREELIELHKFNSSQGVLSIYLNIPSKGRGRERKVRTELNSGLHELYKKHPEDKNLAILIEEIKETFSLIPLSELKRSIVFFLSKNPDFKWQKSFQIPLITKFIWQKKPFLRPLVGMLDKNPDTGILLITSEKIRFLTWRQGLINEELIEEITIDLDSWRRYAGPAPSISAMAQQTSTHTDSFKHRFAEQVDKFLRDIAMKIPNFAKKYKWKYFVLTGENTYIETLKKALESSWQKKIIGTLDQILIKKPLIEIADAVTDLISKWKQKVEEKEIKSLINSALSGGRACLGVTECINSLIEQKVAHLYFCSNLELKGYQRPDGYFVLNPPEEKINWKEEPYLIEKMIDLALKNGVNITPVEGTPADELIKYGGAGAFLHY